MTIYNIFDTSLPKAWSERGMYEFGWDIVPEFCPKLLEVVFVTTSEILASAKTKDHPVVVKYTKPNKEMAAAAIVQFFPNDEDPTKPGNWNLSWTFDEADIPENAQIIDGSDSNVFVYFRAVAGSKFSMEYDAADVINALNVSVLTELKKWLDENSKENDVIGITIENVFQARVAVEGGIKVFAIEPAGEVKMLIKDDAAIEK